MPRYNGGRAEVDQVRGSTGTCRSSSALPAGMLRNSLTSRLPLASRLFSYSIGSCRASLEEAPFPPRHSGHPLSNSGGCNAAPFYFFVFFFCFFFWFFGFHWLPFRCPAAQVISNCGWPRFSLTQPVRISCGCTTTMHPIPIPILIPIGDPFNPTLIVLLIQNCGWIADEFRIEMAN